MIKNNDSHNLQVVIVDDEENSQDVLNNLITTRFPSLNISGIAYSVNKAVQLIDTVQPDIVFLDIALPDGSGFDVLERTMYTGYEVIFQTSFNEYAVQAFEFSALHYLLKPITYEKLKRALDKYKSYKTHDNLDSKLRILKESITDKLNNILLPSGDGLTMYNINEIVRCMADANYTKIFFNSGEHILVSKNLQNFDSMLSGSNFVRVHNSHLINLKYVRKYVRGKHSYIILSDGNEIPISENKKDDFKEQLSHFAKSL
ncbi:MAG: response regulator transcription factor [Bacteroidetes bacterium]|nr:response regulator transcription factor [Bacteroidota bacterium]